MISATPTSLAVSRLMPAWKSCAKLKHASLGATTTMFSSRGFSFTMCSTASRVDRMFSTGMEKKPCRAGEENGGRV